MAFNADAWLEANRPPEFTSGGRTYRGRILSTEEWLELHGWKAVLSEQPTMIGTRYLLRKAITSWFPAPWWLRPLAFFAPGWFNPAYRAFRRLPDKAQQDMLADFSESQRNAMPPLGGARGQPPGTMTTPTSDASRPSAG